MRYPKIPPETAAFEYLMAAWAYLLRVHPEDDPAVLSKTAIELASTYTDIPLHRLRRLSQLARFMNERARAAKLDNIGGDR